MLVCNFWGILSNDYLVQVVTDIRRLWLQHQKYDFEYEIASSIPKKWILYE